MDKKIKGTSLSVINNWVKVLDLYINSNTVFVRCQDSLEDNKENYLDQIGCPDPIGGYEEGKVLFMQEDVALILFMMSEVFFDIFANLELRPAANCTLFLVKEGQDKIITTFIKGRLLLVKRLLSLSSTED